MQVNLQKWFLDSLWNYSKQSKKSGSLHVHRDKMPIHEKSSNSEDTCMQHLTNS